MGTGASAAVAPHELKQLKRSEEDIVMLMMPIYYTHDPVEEEDLKRANTVWNMIINDTAPNYLKMKAEGADYGSCVMAFYDKFYNRLFDVHPLCRSMFKSGLKTQGKFLVKMISLLVTEINADPEKFKNTLLKLTETHNQRGVKSIEYGIVGEVMFWTMGEILGEEFDKETHLSWIRIFSRILSVIVPVAVAYEIKTGGSAQKDRLLAENVMQRNILEFEQAPKANEADAK